jgi:hypothetical protein
MLDKVIANYFVPYSNGKFVATCLMLSPDVHPILSESEIFARITSYQNIPHYLKQSWFEIEYSDIAFWWRETGHDWYNTPNWRDYLSDSVVNTDKWIFYSCHDTGELQYLKNLMSVKTLMIVPDPAMCKSNYLAKNEIRAEPVFESSRVQQDLDNFKLIDSELVFHQRDIVDEIKFTQSMQLLAEQLEINLDINLVLKYRDLYLKNPFNENLS